MSQGKAWNKEEVIEILKPYFQLGCSVNKACKHAGIAQSTVQTWIDNDEELRLKIDAWQGEVSVAARKALRTAIESNNVAPAIEWLKRKEKDEFSDRTETDITSKGNEIKAITGMTIAKDEKSS